MTTAIGYIRVSTDQQAEEGVSLDAQRERLEAYAKMQDLDLVEIIEDAGISGTVPLADRDGGAALIAALVDHQAPHVVALKLDRLFRDAADALNQTRQWDKDKIALHLIDVGGQSINTSSAMGRMFLTMMAGFAELERNLISERTAAALRHKKQKGEVYSALPLGYEDQDGQLVPIDEEMVIVSEIRAMRQDGLSLHKIANDLNGRGIVGKRGGRFYASTIRAILGNDLHEGRRMVSGRQKSWE
ncbi:MAG: recombinase family protein [Kiritimatiellia bacterium]|nr:recombinase family protein [Kiritimatiellia bacterium]